MTRNEWAEILWQAEKDLFPLNGYGETWQDEPFQRIFLAQADVVLAHLGGTA